VILVGKNKPSGIPGLRGKNGKNHVQIGIFASSCRSGRIYGAGAINQQFYYITLIFSSAFLQPLLNIYAQERNVYLAKKKQIADFSCFIFSKKFHYFCVQLSSFLGRHSFFQL
jgi:hypothetical protein